MEIELKPKGGAYWRLTDSSIYLGGLARKTIPLQSIIETSYQAPKGKSLGMIWFRLAGEGRRALSFSESDVELAKKAFDYIKSHCGGKDANEIRMRCRVCGKIFCYTHDDLKENSSNATKAALFSVGTVASAIGGTSLDVYANEAIADRYGNRVKDYSKCPYCNSTDIEALSKDAFREAINVQSMPQKTSAADEIKKYKELLDIGAITQEEFDAKKKQLLGL